MIIQLSKGQVALIDDDMPAVSSFKWTATWSKTSGSFYGQRTIRLNGRQHPVMLHRDVMAVAMGRPLERNEQVDHINHDTLDCRRENLRIATASQNRHNMKITKRNKSGFKGVSALGKKWRAVISANGKFNHIGLFDTPEAAAIAYDEAAQRLHGEFAFLNFPLASK